MKQIFTVLLILFSMLIKAQENEFYIGKTTDLKSEFYLIQGTITKSEFNNNLIAWVKEYYLNSRKIKGKVYKSAYKMQRIIVDCSSNKFGITDGTTYTKSGVLLENYHVEDYAIEMIPTVPNSIGFSIVSTICN